MATSIITPNRRPPSLLVVAQRLVSQFGFSVIPVARSTKRPIVEWAEFQSRHATPAELRVWFGQAGLNLGIVTGAVSGIVVVDVDDAEAQAWAASHLPPTPMRVETPRGGVHLFFKHPGGHVGNRVCVQPAGCPAPLRLDIKADGACVMGVGSRGANGRRYRAPDPWPSSIDALPVYDPVWLQEAAPPAPPPRVAVASSLPVIERARRYLAQVPCPPIGSGSDTATFIAACRVVRGFALTPSEAEDLLAEWASANGQRWSRAWLRQKIASALRPRLNGEPVGGLL